MYDTYTENPIWLDQKDQLKNILTSLERDKWKPVLWWTDRGVLYFIWFVKKNQHVDKDNIIDIKLLFIC